MGNIKDLLNGLALGATFATGIGFIQYARGSWPFTEVPDNEYHLTQWFNETKGPVLEGPGTVWFISPFIKKVVDENKVVIAIPKRGQQRDIKDLEYLAQDGIQGILDIQYRWLIPNSTDAKKFYWEIEGKDGAEDEIEGRIEQVDETLGGALKEAIASRIGTPDSLLERKYLKDLVKRQGANEIELKERELKELKERELKGIATSDYPPPTSIYNTFGVKITDLRLINPRPSEASIEILQTPFKAAQALKATKKKAEATGISIEAYINAANALKQAGTELGPGDIAMYLMDLDNNQEVGETKGTVIKLSPQIPKAIGPQVRNRRS